MIIEPVSDAPVPFEARFRLEMLIAPNLPGTVGISVGIVVIQLIQGGDGIDPLEGSVEGQPVIGTVFQGIPIYVFIVEPGVVVEQGGAVKAGL